MFVHQFTVQCCCSVPLLPPSLPQARVEHLLMQNKELLSHLQKLMSQLSQIQTLQQSMVTATAAAAPPTQTTPMTSPAPLSQATTVSDTNLSAQHDPLLASEGEESLSPLTDPQTSLVAPQDLPAMTSTPSTKTSTAADEVVSPSDMSLGLDFDLVSAPPATNDPFLPQEASSS